MPSAEGTPHRPHVRRWVARILPSSFQARLTLGFASVVALTLVLVSGLVIKSIDDYFYNQEQVDLRARAGTVRDFVVAAANSASGTHPVVGPDNTLDASVRSELGDLQTRQFLADRLAQANVQVEFGLPTHLPDGSVGIVPAPQGAFSANLTAAAQPGQSREPISLTETYEIQNGQLFTYAVRVTLSQPLTFKASTIRDISGVLVVIAILTLGIAFIVAAIIAQRFTTPLRRLTDASRRLAEGDLSSRVPRARAASSSTEIATLSEQFNHMASQLQESVEFIRRERDLSRNFLADVSHELRTPLAALRTFNELLKERAGDDPAAREEFLESSGQQIERLDWLAQNLLELSKLESGLVLLDLRPEDLRAAVESAVEQAAAAARRRGVQLSLSLPEDPVRIRHDPQRVGQVVANLVGNALKFTPRSGSVEVVLRPREAGAEIQIRDTGVGIDPAELPHIFERFFRGSNANEARSSGSGLGLAIVKSIVDMHGGLIAVESRLGQGTTFDITLPEDPRTVAETPPPMPSVRGTAAVTATGTEPITDGATPGTTPGVGTGVGTAAATAPETSIRAGRPDDGATETGSDPPREVTPGKRT